MDRGGRLSTVPASPSEASPQRSRADGALQVGLRLLQKLLNALPRERAISLAGAAGRAWARLPSPRTDTVLRNLRIAFPDWSEAQRRAMAERSFANLARGFAELCTLGRLDAAELRELVDIEGFEHVEAALEVSKTGGLICLTGHIGSWELLVAAMAAHGLPITVVHRGRDHPVLDDFVVGLREQGGAELLHRGSAARGALRALKEGKILAMPMDQNAPRSEGVFVPFFSRLACTRDGPARIAMHSGAPALPTFIERIGESTRHRVRILPALELDPAGEDKEAAVLANVARMNAALEDGIRHAPDQWTWTHRRWRTQPLGEPRPYPSRRRGRGALGRSGDAALEPFGR